jgi:hypothetical protein
METTKTEWQFRIARPDEVGTFLQSIGFADLQKQEKALDAFRLVHEIGTAGAVDVWLRKYSKIGGVWVKRRQD